MRDVTEPFAPPVGPQPATGRVLHGKHVLGTLLAFFGVVFAVNGYFLFSALKTHTGVVALEPYRKGLAYNERIKASDTQAALGWREEIQASRQGRIDVTMTARDGAPVTGLAITGTLTRPATGDGELKLQFAEGSPGRYTMAAPPIEAGAWLVAFEARQDAAAREPDFRARRRLWLAP